MHKFPEQEELGVFGSVDAVNQNRPDGGNTERLLIGLAPSAMMNSEMAKASVASGGFV